MSSSIDQIIEELEIHLTEDHERRFPGYWNLADLEMAHRALHRMGSDHDHEM